MDSVQEDPFAESILKTQSSYDIQGLNSDNYEFLDEVQEELRNGGLENLNLIIGIDYTFSNTVRGKKSFGGENLHHQSSQIMNPYQNVLFIICKTLEKFDKNSMFDLSDLKIEFLFLGLETKKLEGILCFYYHLMEKFRAIVWVLRKFLHYTTK
jgi:hypothetical protein